MSQRVNPTVVGLFVVGAIVLAVVGIGALGSGQLFSSRTTYISYFDESVNGLDVGAPVKFKGVPIGEVTDVKLRLDLENATFQVPVQYAIDLDPVTDTTGVPLDLNEPEELQAQIDDGLRAQLQLESIVTGQLYVELTYVSNPEPVRTPGRSTHLEIPTVLSPLAKIGEEASGLVTNLRSFDVSQINENLVTFLVNANDKLEKLDAEEINRSILSTVESVQAVIESEEVRATLQDLPKATEELRATIADARQLVQRLDKGVDPTADELKKTSQKLRTTLKQMRGTMSEIDQTLSTDSGVGYQMEEALSNLSEATRALQVLLESLERNPSIFLRGREEPPPPNQQ